MDDDKPHSVGRLLRQQAATAAFGSYAFREASLDAVLAEAARACAEGIGVPLCKVCRYRPAERDLLVVAGHGWKEDVVGTATSAADATSPQGRAYVTRRPVVIEDMAVAEGFEFPPFYAGHGIASSPDVVIQAKEGPPFGVLEIDSTRPRSYGPNDIAFLTGMCNVLAEAVAGHERMEAMAAAIAENKVLAAELKHRVRNNLQLVGFMLDRHIGRWPEPPEQRASAQAILRRVLTLAEIYEHLLGTGRGRTVDLADYLRSLCGILPGMQADTAGGTALDCEAQPLMASLDVVTTLGMAVAELVSNSFEHARSDKPLAIALRLSAAGNEGLLVVRDNGPGFDERPNGGRHGVGLVRRLLSRIGGSAELRRNGGSEWVLRFPLREAAALDAP